MNPIKLREAVPQTNVFKDQGLISTFKAANIPAFLRDWILKRKADVNGRIGNPEELRQYVGKIIPQKSQKLEIIDEAQQCGATRKFLANIRVQLNISSNKHTFEIPDLDIRHSETIIEDYVWDRIKEDVTKTSGGWGLIQLGYLPPDESNFDLIVFDEEWVSESLGVQELLPLYRQSGRIPKGARAVYDSGVDGCVAWGD